jgi:hypothetical protein
MLTAKKNFPVLSIAVTILPFSRKPRQKKRFHTKESGV